LASTKKDQVKNVNPSKSASMTSTPENISSKLSQQLKLQTAANRYAKLLQDNATKVIDKIVRR
jgi:hypothetical protein